MIHASGDNVSLNFKNAVIDIFYKFHYIIM